MFNGGDVVYVKSIKKDGIIIDVKLDQSTGNGKYEIFVGEKHTVITDIDDLVFVDTLEKAIEKAILNQSKHMA